MTKVTFWGSSKLSLEVLKKLFAGGDYKILAVVSSTHTPVSAWARERSISVLVPDRLNQEFVDAHLEYLQNDLNIVAAFGKIIPSRILALPKRGNVNIHGSILPKYRGASPIQSAILNQDTTTGVTTALMDEQMDHGPILSTREIKIEPDETFESLESKMANVGSELLLETLPKYLSGSLKPKGQNHHKATYCALIKKEDGYFDLGNPPSKEALDAKIRAYYPWPNVWTRWSPSAKASGDEKGKIVKFYPGGKVQMEGKKVAQLSDFLRGYPNFTVKSLG